MKRDAALLYSAQVFYKATGFVLTAALARLVAPDDLGAFFFATALATTFVAAASLGISPLVLRRVARDPAAAPRLVAASLALRLALLLPFIALVAILGRLVRADGLVLGAAAGVIVGLEDVYFTLASIFLGLRRPRLNVAIGVPLQLLFVAGTPLALWLHGSLGVLLAAHAARSLLLVAAAWSVAAWLIGGGRPRWQRGFTDGVFPFAAAALVTAMAEQIDRVVLGIIADDAQVAAFALAARTIAATLFIPMVAAQVLAPRVAADGLVVTLRAGRRILLLVAAAGLAGGAVLLVVPGLVGRVLFGGLGAAVAPVLAVLAPLVPMSFAATLLASLLQAAGRERAVMWMAAAGGAVGLTGAALLVPRLGAIGAAHARVAAGVAQVAIAVWATRQR